MNGEASAIVTALTSVATQATNAIGDIVPVAAPVMGAVLVIKIGIRLFKFITRP